MQIQKLYSYQTLSNFLVIFFKEHKTLIIDNAAEKQGGRGEPPSIKFNAPFV
jgi:hypothetical protein